MMGSTEPGMRGEVDGLLHDLRVLRQTSNSAPPESLWDRLIDLAEKLREEERLARSKVQVTRTISPVQEPVTRLMGRRPKLPSVKALGKRTTHESPPVKVKFEAPATPRKFDPPKQSIAEPAREPRGRTVKSERRRSRKAAEWTFPARWWSAGPAVLMAVLLVGATMWLMVDRGRSRASARELARLIDKEPTDLPKLTDAFTRLRQSPLDRFDPRGDYLVARAMDRLNHPSMKGNKGMVAARDKEWLNATRQNIERAIRKAPGNPWYRLSLARWAETAGLDREQRIELLRPAQALDPRQAVFTRALAECQLSAGKTEGALASFRELLTEEPERTREVLESLVDANLGFELALTAAPATAQAGLEAANFLKDHQRPWREFAERLLTQTPPNATNAPEDLAARGSLLQLLGRPKEAAAAFADALARRPKRNDWRITLARILYEQERYEESDRLAKEVAGADPTAKEATEARLLREKIVLATDGASKSGKAPLSAN